MSKDSVNEKLSSGERFPEGQSLAGQKEFLDTIRFYRGRINLADFLDKQASAFFVGAGAGIVFQAVAFVLPFYDANLYTAFALVLSAAAAFAAALLKRCSMKRAALVMDGFGFQERIVTAYENMGQEGELIELQRKDAMRRLQAERGRIRIRLCPRRRKMAALAGVCLLLPVLALIPSPVKERAGELHQFRQEAKEKVGEIEDAISELEELKEQGGQELTEEQLAALQEMIDSLKSSVSEYQQAASAGALTAAGAKLDYKYGSMGSELARLAESLQGGVSASLAQAVGETAQSLQGMGGTPSTGQGNMASAGNDGSGEGMDGQGSGSGSGDGQGDGSGDGQGSGTGDGSGSGSGDGQGDGSGSGTGNGSGDGGASGGRGEGSGTAKHDYVSVPNAVADSGSLTGNAGGHEDSEYFRAQNGLSWEGEHVSHEAVIGSYQERAYEGVAAGRYPDGMEDVIKDYFSSF